MPHLINHSPYAAHVLPSWDETGADVLLVAVKGTFTLEATPTLAAVQQPISLAYAHTGDPGASSPTAVPEVTLPTGGTDVVLIGTAHAPGGQEVIELDTMLAVAGKQKVVRVVGDRLWRLYPLGLASAPKPFATLPLIYERAFGGPGHRQAVGGGIIASNPVGTGWRGTRSVWAMGQTPLPNLQHPHMRAPWAPADPVACYSWVAPHWAPRHGYAGTYDAAWQRQRAPFFPDDFDRRFFRAGPQDLYTSPCLQGGEVVTLQHLCPEPWLQFALPTQPMQVRARGIALGPVRLGLEAVIVEPNKKTFCLLWRALVPCDKQLLRVHALEITRL